jgi:hypothetical protein
MNLAVDGRTGWDKAKNTIKNYCRRELKLRKELTSIHLIKGLLEKIVLIHLHLLKEEIHFSDKAH